MIGAAQGKVAHPRRLFGTGENIASGRSSAAMNALTLQSSVTHALREVFHVTFACKMDFSDQPDRGFGSEHERSSNEEPRSCSLPGIRQKHERPDDKRECRSEIDAGVSYLKRGIYFPLFCASVTMIALEYTHCSLPDTRDGNLCVQQ